MQKTIHTYLVGFCIGFATPCYAMDDAKNQGHSNNAPLATMLDKQQKDEILPYWRRPISYDCTVIVQKPEHYGESEKGISEALCAGQHSIERAQAKILVSIRDYTRDYTARPDGKLEPDQRVLCEFHRIVSKNHITMDFFSTRSGDAWQEIEKLMCKHAGITLPDDDTKE